MWIDPASSGVRNASMRLGANSVASSNIHEYHHSTEAARGYFERRTRAIAWIALRLRTRRETPLAAVDCFTHADRSNGITYLNGVRLQNSLKFGDAVIHSCIPWMPKTGKIFLST